MKKKLRVLITVGTERTDDSLVLPHTYSTQIEFLRRAGNEVRLFGIDDRTSPGGIFRNIIELMEEIAEFRPDLIVTYYGAIVAAISRIGAGKKPFVVTFRGSDLLGSSNPGFVWKVRDRISRALGIWAASGARQIIVNGSGLIKSLPPSLRRKSHNIPNGINTDVYAPKEKVEARRSLNWPLYGEAILFNSGVGSGKVVKNRPLAEEVYSLLLECFPNLRLETISTCTRDEVAVRMNACDCLLVTSLHEGSPDLVKEAMASNLPVVSVPCGDVPERLQGVTLSSIQPYDAKSLARAVEDVLLTGHRSNGREKLIAQGLDILSVTERVLSVYILAVEGNRHK